MAANQFSSSGGGGTPYSGLLQRGSARKGCLFKARSIVKFKGEKNRHFSI